MSLLRGRLRTSLQQQFRKHASAKMTRNRIQKNEESPNYLRKEKGGARPAHGAQCFATGDKETTETSSSPTSRSAGCVAAAAIAGGLCRRLIQAEFLSPPAWRAVHLLEADSSISARIACRSSEAEITGNNRTKPHPRISEHCSGVTVHFWRALAPPRHSQYAGTASNIHARLSNSSTLRDKTPQSKQARKRGTETQLPKISFPETSNPSQRDPVPSQY
jgi:hypothetical protein